MEDSFDVADAGLKGITALLKMRESALRWCRVSASVSEDEDGVDASCAGKDVASGESMGRVARGDLGRPKGLDCVNDDILSMFRSVQICV